MQFIQSVTDRVHQNAYPQCEDKHLAVLLVDGQDSRSSASSNEMFLVQFVERTIKGSLTQKLVPLLSKIRTRVSQTAFINGKNGADLSQGMRVPSFDKTSLTYDVHRTCCDGTRRSC